jgi:rare lipoprotein A
VTRLTLGRSRASYGHRLNRTQPTAEHAREREWGGGPRATAARRGGAFRLEWGLPDTGTYTVRAYGVHDRSLSGSASARRGFTVYRRALASYYGPGLYGNGVACGGTLEPGTLGAANKTLPCGTKVRLSYHGRTVTVPVIDRGPYVAGRDYDLTEATKQRLHFPGLGVVLSSR